MRPQELSSSIWGMSCGGLRWDVVPSPIRWSINVALRRVGEKMSPQVSFYIGIDISFVLAL
jgi:hypothetical protein